MYHFTTVYESLFSFFTSIYSCYFSSTKSEKGPLGAGSETGLNSSGKTVSEQEKARRQTEGSNRLTQSTSAGEVRHLSRSHLKRGARVL